MTLPINQSQIARTTAQWTSLNPILALDSIGIEVMSNGYNRYKRGDGVTRWLGLAYIDKVYTGAEITVDAAPTSGSGNPVSSNGVYDALGGKQAKISNTANGVFYGSGVAGTLSQTSQPSVGSMLWQGSTGAPCFAALADVITAAKATIVNTIYPVGSIYMSVNSTSPATLFGGSWTQLKNRFLLGAGSSYSNGSTGGAATHTLSTSEMPSHRHQASTNDGYWVWGGDARNDKPPAGTATSYWTKLYNINTGYTGGGAAHNNMPPYLVVYMWRRTA